MPIWRDNRNDTKMVALVLRFRENYAGISVDRNPASFVRVCFTASDAAISQKLQLERGGRLCIGGAKQV